MDSVTPYILDLIFTWGIIMHSQVFANYSGCKQEVQGYREVSEMAVGQIF